MLTPEQIQQIADTLLPLLDGLNVWIMKDMIRRLMARIGRGEEAMLTASDEWQAQVLQEAGGHLEDVRAEIQRVLPLTDDEVARIFEDAAIKSLEADNRVYIQAGGRKLGLSRRMIEILTDTYQRTKGTLHNLTRTTAENSQRKLIQLLDSAHMRVYTGAQSYTAAVSETVKELCDTQTKILYPSGHTDTIETAVLRAVRTGTAQAAGNMSLQGMEENGWDLVRVSAHIGARYGDGGQNPGNHFWWQGKLYSKSGRNKRYPPFVETTGYGTGEGLCGWNCRHSFGPGDPNHNPFKDFDAEENKKAYDLSQRQRTLERRIRHTKAKLVTLREGINTAEDAGVKAALEEEYSRTAMRLNDQNREYTDFCKENRLKPLPDRIQLAKWTREDAKKSMMAVKDNVKITFVQLPQMPSTQPQQQAMELSEQPSSKKYQVVTANWYPDAKPGSHEVQDLQSFTVNGVTYTVDGNNVVLDYKPKEKAIAELLAKEVGGEIYMVPRVNYPQGVSTPDFLFNGNRYDLKTIQANATKNTLFNRIKKSSKQSDNFIIDVTDSGLTDATINSQIDKIFWSQNTQFVNEIVVIRDGKIFKVFRRIQKS